MDENVVVVDRAIKKRPRKGMKQQQLTTDEIIAIIKSSQKESCCSLCSCIVFLICVMFICVMILITAFIWYFYVQKTFTTDVKPTRASQRSGRTVEPKVVDASAVMDVDVNVDMDMDMDMNMNVEVEVDMDVDVELEEDHGRASDDAYFERGDGTPLITRYKNRKYRMSIPITDRDAYIFRPGHLIEVRNLTADEVQDMEIDRISLLDIFYEMDILRNSLQEEDRPSCLAHHHVMLNAEADNNAESERPGFVKPIALNLISIWLNNSTPTVIHAVNPEYSGERLGRVIIADSVSVRWPERQRILAQKETLWLDYYDVDIEIEDMKKGGARRYMSRIRLRGVVSFCVDVSMMEMMGIDSYYN